MKATAISDVPEIQYYIDLVLEKKIRACIEQIKLCKFVIKVFENEEIYVDTDLLKRYLDLQKYFPFKLFPWEKFVFALHNCTFRKDGFLRFPDAHIYVGRGSGKNGYSAFEQFCNISPVNGVREYHIMTVAASEDNAKQSFEELYNILESNPKFFKKYFKWSLTKITNLKTMSSITFGTSAPKSKDGGRQGEIIFDEKHSFENYDLINVLEGGLGKKDKTRSLSISSFGDVIDGPMDEDVKADLQILDGIIDDNGTLPFICRLNDEGQVDDEGNWIMACPSIEYLATVKERYRRDYKKYKQNPAANLSFMTKRMGIRKGKNNRPVTSLDNIMATNQTIPDVRKMKCILAIDYARLNDFASAGFLFYVSGKVVWLQHSWVCRNSKDLIEKRVVAPLEEYEARGELTFTDDVEISVEKIADWVEQQIIDYSFKPVNFSLDSFRYALVKNAFANIGFDTDKNRKNNIKLTRPSDIIKTVPVIDSYFTKHNVIFGDCKIMRWYTNNVMLRPEKRDEWSYGKIDPKSRKTDGFMAFAHAMTQLDFLIGEIEGNSNVLYALENAVVYEL